MTTVNVRKRESGPRREEEEDRRAQTRQGMIESFR